VASVRLLERPTPEAGVTPGAMPLAGAIVPPAVTV
jgi:hypothetical protein